MATFIQPEDSWLLWTFIIILTALAIYLEQRTKWGAKVTGPIIGLGLALIASNLNIIPMQSSVYDAINVYLVPLAVVLLLLKADIRSIFRTTKKTMIAFHLTAIGSFLGTLIGVALIHKIMPTIIEIAPAMCATYIGGSINFIAMTNTYRPSGNIMSAAIVADNLVMAVFVLLQTWMPSSKLFRRFYPHPYELEAERADSGELKAAHYWKPKQISLIDIAIVMAIAFGIAAVSAKGSALMAAHTTGVAQAFFGNQFVILTTLTLVVATLFPDFFKKLNGADEIGTFFIYIFFVTVGIPASIKEVVTQAPLLLVFCFVICAMNLIFGLGLGKLCKCSIEEISLGSNAAIAGPSNSAALAIARGWQALVVPGLLVGLWGDVIGNYCGIIMGSLLGLI